jgi:2-oxoglutarate ferredoxin oxidoreductase subunit delta
LSKSYKLELNRKWCKDCGICLGFCPTNVFTWDEKRRLLISHPEKCIGCKMCEFRCPDLAIKVIEAEVDKNG